MAAVEELAPEDRTARTQGYHGDPHHRGADDRRGHRHDRAGRAIDQDHVGGGSRDAQRQNKGNGQDQPDRRHQRSARQVRPPLTQIAPDPAGHDLIQTHHREQGNGRGCCSRERIFAGDRGAGKARDDEDDQETDHRPDQLQDDRTGCHPVQEYQRDEPIGQLRDGSEGWHGDRKGRRHSVPAHFWKRSRMLRLRSAATLSHVNCKDRA